ncbi:MAG: 3-hydroxyacyl-[acyl-carrier-protein] dehydratase FabZ [Desulfobacterales bacterium CG07_land_8_20_14_0_80_52_14]|nr:MAG: 3-hydroxyacyl-[acyl-carrier-protein] dehydratase FabZ [Desulfobacterales bacterium CG23_combo_of_CG06-09_8_20_14_all_52_9]PIU49338.1 MAG: 3-hydroxyacyl-[acyl-carrier-protein] dehydratase FabZ [Desulfobacterales bacterium CG07_land_8_20_14_0_80_52_14]
MYDIQRIMGFLPHRYPFLLIDRIIELVPRERAVALKNVTINEPFFQGHFPQAPVMPGVLIVEAMGQAGGVLAFESISENRKGALIYFMGIDKVRFRKPVIPGDQLIFEVRILKLRSKVIKMAGVAKVDGKLVTEAELMASIGESE